MGPELLLRLGTGLGGASAGVVVAALWLLEWL